MGGAVRPFHFRLCYARGFAAYVRGSDRASSRVRECTGWAKVTTLELCPSLSSSPALRLRVHCLWFMVYGLWVSFWHCVLAFVKNGNVAVPFIIACVALEGSLRAWEGATERVRE